MTSLREEIFDIIYRDGDGNDFAQQCTDLILAKFEKRIASLKRGELYRAYNAALEDLEEILKK